MSEIQNTQIVLQYYNISTNKTNKLHAYILSRQLLSRENIIHVIESVKFKL